MSDNKEHTTQGGVDWELRTAEDAMVAAPGGSRELALAMRRHADGVRNMMQSELVPSFEHAIDRMMERRVIDVLASVQRSLDTQMDLVQQVLATAREALTVSKAGAARLGKIELDMRALDKRHGAQIKALAKDIAAIKKVIASRPAERAADQRRLEERLARMEQRLAALEAHHAE